METPMSRDDRSFEVPRPQAYATLSRSESLPRRIEWIAIVLVVVNTVMMVFSVSLYYDDSAMGQAVIAAYTASAMVLLPSVMLSIFGFGRFSTIALAVGLVAMMVSFWLLGIELIDRLASEAYVLA